MTFYDNNHDVYFKESPKGDICLSVAVLFFEKFTSPRNTTGATGQCPAPITSVMLSEMDGSESSLQLVLAILHILCTILPTLFWFSLARILVQECSVEIQKNAVLRFLIEFIVITVPTIICINAVNDKVEYILAIAIFFMWYFIWQSECLQQVKERNFLIGTRPRMLTLGRAAINFLTAFCILAIDFDSFPKKFRKSRSYGAGLMDTGIGLFVFAMGSVSRKPKHKRDLWRMLRIVVPLLLLGFARTIVIESIGYNQDQHEYGQHLNAFFTLGLTKLFGTLASSFTTKSVHLLALGCGILFMHEFTLQMGIGAYVVDHDVERNNLIDANREGLCSLPGFVGIFVLSMFLGELWQTSELPLKLKEFLSKMKIMFYVCLIFGTLTVASAYSIGISRVTCNFGYAVWTLSIASIMIFLFMFLFDFVLDTLWPIEPRTNAADGGEAATLLKVEKTDTLASSEFVLPSLIEAVNMNGLVFFLVANILTGGVNIFLKPENRSHFAGYLILFVYMFLSTGLVFFLYRRKIRIG